MTPAELRSALAALHWSQRGFAEVAGVDARQVRRWVAGDAAIPAPVAHALRILAACHVAYPFPPASVRRKPR